MPHLIRAAEVSVDKSQLLRGQPTAITLDLNGTDIASILQGVMGEVIDVTPLPVSLAKT